MEIKQAPFSLYDFLGYFVPGAAVIYLLGPASLMLGLKGVASSLASFSSVGDVLPFVITSYVIGHLNALCSSILVERFALWRYDYPSKYLLGQGNDGYWRAAGFPAGFLGGALMLPVVIGDFVFGQIFRLSRFYCKPLDPMLTKLIRVRVDSILSHMWGGLPDVPFPASSSDYFRPAYHFAVEKAPAHLPKMQNYVALFGFYRAFCLVSVASFWWLVSSLVLDGFRSIVASSAIGSIVVSYMFFVGFLKFYRRFSLEALMAVVVIKD